MKTLFVNTHLILSLQTDIGTQHFSVLGYYNEF